MCAILYPKPLDFKFYQDSVKFILFLAFMASLGMIYSLVMYIRNGVSLSCHVCHEQCKSLCHVHQEQCMSLCHVHLRNSLCLCVMYIRNRVCLCHVYQEQCNLL